jgi:hypothetical protein
MEFFAISKNFFMVLIMTTGSIVTAAAVSMLILTLYLAFKGISV